MKKTNCIFYAETKRREYCKALKELYCINEECKFYKPEPENTAGAKKEVKHENSTGNPERD